MTGLKIASSSRVTLTRLKLAFFTAVLILFTLVFLGFDQYNNNRVVIETKDQKVTEGKVVKGISILDDRQLLQTNNELVFESSIIEPPLKNANAAILKWNQDGGEEGFDVELRTNNGGTWSEWSESVAADDRKDGAPIPRAALILGNDIKSVQYRFKLKGTDAIASPVIDTSQTALEMVDTTRGPEPTKPKSVVDKLLGAVGINNKASAVADGPPVFSRGAWGAPEPNNSPRWSPEYRPLSRVIIHHTATSFNSDIGAQLRAIWHYHANTLEWGDIGYNYLVDHGGNIFQGRYYDQGQAETQKGEVVGGHAYGNNYGTTGISLIGDFTNVSPTGAAMQAAGDIAAYKMHKFDLNPAAGTNLIGHRDVSQTGCPGNQFYPQLNTVRNASSGQYYKYSSMFKLDSQFFDEGVDGISTNSVTLNPGQTAQAYIDVTNTGLDTWSNNTANTIYLGTDVLRDRASAFVHNSWVTYNRPTSFSYKVNVHNGNITPSNTIMTGETGRFEFKVQAPFYGGTYKEYFHLLSEGRAWLLRNQGIHFNINVPEPTYVWQPVSQEAYTDDSKQTPVDLNAIQPGQRFYVTTSVRNSSNQVWLKNGSSPVRLGTSQPLDRASSFTDTTWPAGTRPSLLNEETVNPGESSTFGFWMKAPDKPGQYKEYFDILAEGRRWMIDYGMHWTIRVVDQ